METMSKTSLIRQQKRRELTELLEVLGLPLGIVMSFFLGILAAAMTLVFWQAKIAVGVGLASAVLFAMGYPHTWSPKKWAWHWWKLGIVCNLMIISAAIVAKILM